LGNSDEEIKRTSQQHNIMRFGRTAGHNIMRFGRAGHNIMHFGKRDGITGPGLVLPVSQESLGNPYVASAASNLGPAAPGLTEVVDEQPTLDYQSLYVKRRSTLGPRLLIPHLFLSSLYTPYRRFNLNYNKKADNRDNVFMHFG